nr:gluconokinase, GntK/IdnK-type [Parvularcula dongshanensis]
MVKTLVVIGPSGCGKTTIGTRAAEIAGVPFFEGDAYHSEAAVEKMSEGGALTNEERLPWIARIGKAIAAEAPDKAVLACSALNLTIRAALRTALPGEIGFVLLDVPPEELRRRLTQRQHHFAGAAMLESQIAAMDKMTDVDRVDGTKPPKAVAKRVARLVDDL